MLYSHGVNGHIYLSDATRNWLGGLTEQLPDRFWVHQDTAARQAANLLGADAFARGNRIFLGNVPANRVEHVIRHELVHLAQMRVAIRGGQATSLIVAEQEAEVIANRPLAVAAQHGIHPDGAYCFIPLLVAAGFGLYVFLRASPANAPGPDDKPLPSVSTGQIVGEGLAIFVVPGGMARLGGRIGLGFFGRSMLANASVPTGVRAVDDMARGQASPPLLYLTDAVTGTVIGFVVPGGFKLIGQAGTFAFDRLATFGLKASDIRITEVLARAAEGKPVDATQAYEILAQRNLAAQVSEWYFEKRGIMLLYRGQEIATPQILSPLARDQGAVASQQLVAKLKALGYSDADIASFSARHHTDLFNRPGDPPDLLGLRPGTAGIPVTGIPAIAAGFAREGGVIYVIRAPRSIVFRPIPWPVLRLEDEYTIFNQLPPGSTVQIIPAGRIPALTVDELGRLTTGFKQ